MTTRHYKCTACHHEFEARQELGDETLKYCPWCNHQQLEETEEEG
jgi:putative FmdB family regulatory protein